MPKDRKAFKDAVRSTAEKIADEMNCKTHVTALTVHGRIDKQSTPEAYAQMRKLEDEYGDDLYEVLYHLEQLDALNLAQLLYKDLGLYPAEVDYLGADIHKCHDGYTFVMDFETNTLIR